MADTRGREGREPTVRNTMREGRRRCVQESETVVRFSRFFKPFISYFKNNSSQVKFQEVALLVALGRMVQLLTESHQSMWCDQGATSDRRARPTAEVSG
jgi:hypothetical protein